MKKTTIAYWIFTSLFAFFMLGSAIPNIMMMKMSVDGFKSIGYPAYLVPFLGVAKTLGVAAILIPGFRRIKEWAYAGLIFDLAGAIYSVIAVGMPPLSAIPIVVILLIGFSSYYFYHKKRHMRVVASQQLNRSNNPGLAAAL
jgi:hypothetical protein